ncbi:SDR family NAD(P)-dependent oxidoreductase [Bordetella bronchiseptica]|uniref:SDR family NAD(P)-dependent oxidoreductase n=1 Tax=Bordetella bronchiseptica TaxID=518 RepID=UPI00028FDB85|nr:SDR family NAD(P)-dependent oxidoreductase [Bordetella bronchiseptica]KAK67235.1 putative 2-(S)-hydroxypropyl-CoM dehydrogenase [Bordetella bronchiseptica MO211]CCN17636.1 short-chain alcohol dehydrogenase [Bordetella bronchiseptica MO211]
MAEIQRLLNRRIVITGAASGIGLATARLFAAEGAALTLLDRNAPALQSVARDIQAQAFEADICDEGSVSHAVAQGAAAMGGIDGVVNAAGVMLRGSVLEIDVAQWRRVLEINLTGTYIVVRCCLPWLKQAPHASVVNLGSGQSLLPNTPNRTAYSASKGGVLNLTRALAAELAPSIRANTVCPGLVDTPMAEGVQGNVGNYALRRLAQPEEIARAILYLTSDESSYVTGAALAVDGGRSFH